MDEVVDNLKACLLISKGGVSENRICKDYYDVTGDRIPYRKFNFASLEEFLKVIPGIKRVLRGGEYFIEVIPTNKTAHLANLVRHQKTSKRPSKKVSYNRPARTPYGSNNYQRNQARPQSNFRTPLPPANAKSSSQYSRAPVQNDYRVPQSSARSTTSYQNDSRSQFQSKTSTVSIGGSSALYQSDSRSQSQSRPRSSTPIERSPTPTNSRNSNTSTSSQNGTIKKSSFTYPPSKTTDYIPLPSQRPNYMKTVNEGPTASPSKKMMDRDARIAAAPKSADGSAKPKSSLQSRLIVPKTTDTAPSQIRLNEPNVEKPTPVLRPTDPAKNICEKEDVENEPPKFYSMIPFEQFLEKKPVTQKATPIPAPLMPQSPMMPPPQMMSLPHILPHSPMMQNTQRIPQAQMMPQAPVVPPAPKIRQIPTSAQGPEAELASLVDGLQLPEPVYKILPAQKGCIYAQVTVGKEKYSSYPEDAKSEKAAQAIAAAKALTDFKEKNLSTVLPVTSDVRLIVTRILQIVDAHSSGVFTSQISTYYKQEFKELLPADWLRIVNNCPEISIEVGANNTSILTRYTPEKAQETPLLLSPSELSPQPSGQLSPILSSGSSQKSSNELSQNIPELVTPNDRYWIVHVNVVRPSEIWAQLVGEDYSDRLHAMQLQMNEFYAKNFESTKAKSIEPGLHYAIYENDKDHWSRVRCLNRDPETDEVTVFFIDDGDDEICNSNLLHELDKQFCELPVQAIRLALHGLEVFADSEEAMTVVKKYLQSSEDLTLYIDVLNDDADELSYDVEEDCWSVTFCDTNGPEDINLNELIAKDIIETCMPKPHLKEGRITEVYVSHVSNTGDIYVQLKNESLKFLVDLMNFTIINKLSQDLSKLTVQKVNLTKLYMVKDEDGNWHRASVMNVNYPKNEIDAFLMDFGRTIITKISTLVDLESISKMLAQIPGQALKLRLHNVPPSSFDAEKVARLKELASPDTSLLVKEVIRSNDSSPPTVELLKRQEPSNEIITINNTLVLDKELSCPNNDDDNNNVGTRKRSERLTSRYGSSADRTDPCQRNALRTPNIPPTGSYFDVHVSMAANPGNFVVQPHEDQLELANMMNKLQEECTTYNGPLPTFDSVREGNLYAGQHDDTSWYRREAGKYRLVGGRLFAFPGTDSRKGSGIRG
ncbi:tudor domain-containing protein 7A-like isoform X2 [Belonocnema kinseyi]|uniref:tudor domain-containing protein 7A-like isoform X2 n=1 Tax=Belonocnema kinseyi TaxID=2817044 RepID=UPI00143DD828|nr:tudor domain-containing protein 7A-like isoform X2 [Belonocnema kinseyi]